MAASICPEVNLDRGWRAVLVRVLAADGELIDRAVVTPYPAPRSYTGEDMMEISVHGSPWIVRAAVDAAVAAGARPAAAGEFTRRAVANGKLDLLQAEAIGDLVAAETQWQARVARAQIAGALSSEVGTLRDALVDLRAALEGTLDFPRHDVPYDVAALEGALEDCRRRVSGLLSTAAAGRRIRDGVRVTIVGPPNAGKSTLFNTLVGSERAIVSGEPGTTRDIIEADLEMAGVAVMLQDTAGLGSTADPVEREGVRRARGAAAEADAVVLLWAADGPRPESWSDSDRRPAIAVRSKWDLRPGEEVEEGWLAVSCRTGEGIDVLRRRLEEVVGTEVADLGGEVAISGRHRLALERAQSELAAADPAQPELGAEAARNALQAVRELTGEVVTEDVLDRVFASFCIGK